jgi:hypothetical protein
MMKRLAVAACVALAATSFETSAKDVVVRSFCPMTHASGIGRAATFEAAKELAIKACLGSGGMAQCCPKFIRRIS